MKQFPMIVLTAALLTACGGGGGGAPLVDDNPGNTPPPTNPVSAPPNPLLSGQQLKCADYSGAAAHRWKPGETDANLSFIAKRTGLNCVTFSWVEFVDPDTGTLEQPFAPLSDIYKTAEYAHSLGLSVALKPYFQFKGAVSFMDQFGMYDALRDERRKKLDDFSQKFLPNYMEWAEKVGKIAQDTSAVFLAIGGEMTPLDSSTYDAFWQSVIARARTVYKGHLTYAFWGPISTDQFNQERAATYGESAWDQQPYHHIDMWKYLDLVGPQIHDPLSQSPFINYEEALNQWKANTAYNQRPVDIIKAWSDYAKKFGKPLISLESGFSTSAFPYDPPNPQAARPATSGLKTQYIQQAELAQSFLANVERFDQATLAGYSYIVFVNDDNPSVQSEPESSVNSPLWWRRYGWTMYQKPALYSFAALTRNDNVIAGDDDGSELVALVGRPSVIQGGLGNDIINARQPFGSSIDGGVGANQLIYYGTDSRDVSIQHTGTGSAKVSQGQFTDTVSHIDTIVFQDRTISLK